MTRQFINLITILSLIIISLSCRAATTLPDFASIKNVKQKKQQFFAYLLPMAKKANHKVKLERLHLLKLQNKKSLSKPDINFINQLSKRYQVNKNDSSQQIAALLIKVDIIPTSLLLAQAANESAWGTSRFAKLGNNLFGQWCYSKNCGIVPSHRTKGMTHEVKKFSSAFESIEAYQHNLNHNQSYQALRNIRASLRKSHKTITGTALAQGLIHYSERGQSYVRDITHFIKHNQLEKR